MKRNSLKSMLIVGLLFFVSSLCFADDSFDYYDKVLKDSTKNKVITSGTISRSKNVKELLKDKNLINDTQKEYDEAVKERDDIDKFMKDVTTIQKRYEENIADFTIVTDDYINQKGECKVMQDKFDIEFRGEKTDEEQDLIDSSLNGCYSKLNSILDKYNSSDEIMYEIYSEMNRLTRLAKIKEISANGLDGFIKSYESLKKFFEGVNYENNK